MKYRWLPLATSAPAQAAPAGAGRTWFLAAAALVLLLAALVRFVTLGDRSLWLDEGFTLAFIAHDWRTLWLTAFDNSPALYYSLLKLVADPLADEWHLRALSAVAGTLWVAIIMATTRELTGRPGTILAGLFAALSAIMIYYSQEARAYALQCLLTSLVIYATVRLLKQDERHPAGLLALYALALVASLYTHMVTVFAWIISAGMVGCWFLLAPQRRLRALLVFVGVNALVVLAWAPWIYLQAFTERAVAFNWLEQMSPQSALSYWLRLQSDVPAPRHPLMRPLKLIAPLVFVLGALAALRTRQLAAWYIVAIYAGGPLLLYAMGFIEPIFIDRTVLWACTAACVLLGMAVSWDRIRPLAVILIATVLALSTVTLLGDELRRKEDWRGVHALLAERVRPGDDILLVHPSDELVLLYYDRRAGAAGAFGRSNLLLVDGIDAQGRWVAKTRIGADPADPYLRDIEWVVHSSVLGAVEYRDALAARFDAAGYPMTRFDGKIRVLETRARPLP